MKTRDELVKENEALAAHVKRQSDLLSSLVEAMHAYEIAVCDPEAPVYTVDIYCHDCISKLKCRWQAEALAAMIAAIPFREELARDMLKHRRDELRRQAEGEES